MSTLSSVAVHAKRYSLPRSVFSRNIVSAGRLYKSPLIHNTPHHYTGDAADSAALCGGGPIWMTSGTFLYMMVPPPVAHSLTGWVTNRRLCVGEGTMKFPGKPGYHAPEEAQCHFLRPGGTSPVQPWPCSGKNFGSPVFLGSLGCILC